MARWGALTLLLAAVVGCGRPAPTSPSSAVITPSRAASITLVSSSPAANSTIVTGAAPNNTPPLSITTLNLTFSATYGNALPGAKLEAELMDQSGTRCGYWFSDARDMAAGVPLTFVASTFSWECPVPTTTASVVVTLLTLTGPTSPLTRTEYLTQSFQIGYRYQLYAEPPAAPGSAPSIASLGWHDMVWGCGGDCSAPGDNIYVYCGVTQPDGGSVTTTLTITWAGHAPQTTTTAFPTGATVLPSRSIMWGGQAAGAVSVLETTVPAIVNGVWPTATAVCSTVNSRGDTATRTIKVPY